jgi:FKBP-type peptidyl-prolyl cis-trans isomerase 2
MGILKEGDFIEVEYTGSVGEQVFDTTNKEVAEEKGLHNPNTKYGSMVICLGRGHLLKGLDEFLIGKEDKKEYDVKLQPDDAFGKKNAQLIQMVPKAKFTKDNINPQPGMQLNIDNQLAVVRQVSGGRIMVDFNHPLAGREVDYKINILKVVEDKETQVKAVVRVELGLQEGMYDLEVKEDKATLKFPEQFKEMLEPIKAQLEEKINESIKLKELKIEYKSEKAPEVAKKTEKKPESNESEETKSPESNEKPDAKN